MRSSAFIEVVEAVVKFACAGPVSTTSDNSIYLFLRKKREVVKRARRRIGGRSALLPPAATLMTRIVMNCQKYTYPTSTAGAAKKTYKKRKQSVSVTRQSSQKHLG